MLDGLDNVPWAHLTHAYGSASDVPVLLRKLASGNAAEREETLYELYGNIWHQGTVYEATAYAVPFLLELIQNTTVPSRWKILVLLASLADGQSYRVVHGPLPRDLEFDQELDRELEWVRTARAAVVDGLPVYICLLQDPNSSVRVAAAYILTRFPERGAETRVVLRSLLDHATDARTRAGLLQALSELSSEECDVQRLRVALVPGESRIVRFIAAQALQRIDGQAAPPEVAEVLVEAVLDAVPLEQQYREWEWPWGGGVLYHSTRALRHLGMNAGLPLLLDLLHQASHDGVMGVVNALLDLAFDGWTDHVARPGESLHPSGADVAACDLTADQRWILEEIARTQHGWHGPSNIGNILRSRGLPSEPGELRSFLAGRAFRGYWSGKR